VAALRNYSIAVVAVAIAIAILELLGPTVNGATAAQVLLLVLIIDARFCGTGPAILASGAAAVGFSRYFLTPTGFAFGDPSDWAALCAFIIMAVVVGELASRAERRAAEAQAGRQEIARLYQELEAAFDRASEAEAARRNEQLKSALLDALTHNLRTPLTAIKAAVTALIGAELWNPDSELSSEGQRELLEVIDQESDRLNRFIEGLSAAGSTDPRQPINLRAVEVLDIVRRSLTRAETVTRDHRIELAIASALPPLSIDAPSIVEVLYILLDNASKYAAAGSTICVTATRHDEHHVEIAVADQGPGIPPELRERVFEKFFRIPGRQSQDPRRGGIGLGLPIARRLVEAQAGRIWVDTADSGNGTAVHLTLPVAVAEENAARTASPAIAAAR
jgi:two-component system sensor histidine kinase KdpD